MMLHRLACHNPGMLIIVVRPTYSSLKLSFIPQFRDKILRYGFGPHPNNPIERAYGGEVPQYIKYKNGARMLFAGMDKDPEKVLGGEYDIVFYNQVEQGKQKHWEILAGRQLEGRRGTWTYPYGKRSLIIGDCNPGPSRHWILQRAAREDSNLELYYIGLKDNPELHDGTDWTEVGINYIKSAKSTYSDDLLKKGLLGLWVSPTGLVYRYDSDTHDIDESDIDIQEDWEWTAACDHGGIHPFVFHLYCGPKDRSCVYLYKEIYKPGLDVDDMRAMLADLLETYLPPGKELEWTVADHRPEINKSLQRLGISIDEADKEILPGIETVKRVLKQVKIRFNKNSLAHDPDRGRLNAGEPIRTVEEFERYSYKDEDKMDGSENDEKPIKAWDDGMDTLRYHLMRWANTPEFEINWDILSQPDTPQPSIFGTEGIF